MSDTRCLSLPIDCCFAKSSRISASMRRLKLICLLGLETISRFQVNWSAVHAFLVLSVGRLKSVCQAALRDAHARDWSITDSAFHYDASV